MLEKIIDSKEIITVIAPALATIIILLSRLFKNKGLKKIAYNVIDLQRLVKEYMCIIEEYKNFSGAEKKEWVKTKVNQYCIENNIGYNDQLVDELIEVLIQFSKNVNKRNAQKGDLL